jgi:hypothetical protein
VLREIYFLEIIPQNYHKSCQISEISNYANWRKLHTPSKIVSVVKERNKLGFLGEFFLMTNLASSWNESCPNPPPRN